MKNNKLYKSAGIFIACIACFTASADHNTGYPENSECYIDENGYYVNCDKSNNTDSYDDSYNPRPAKNNAGNGNIIDILDIIVNEKNRAKKQKVDYKELYSDLVNALCAENHKHPRRMLFDDHFWQQRDFNGIEYFGNGKNNPQGDYNAGIQCAAKFVRK